MVKNESKVTTEWIGRQNWLQTGYFLTFLTDFLTFLAKVVFVQGVLPGFWSSFDENGEK